MPKATNIDIYYRCVDKIFESRSIEEIKASTLEFIKTTTEVQDEQNGMLVYMLCRRLDNLFSKWLQQLAVPPETTAWNAIIVPPEKSPIMLLPSCVPLGGTPEAIVAGMKEFVDRCEEFISPVLDAITSDEIKRVLNIAQKTYGLINIIAPNDPMKILCFANSHVIYNSQCGIPVDTSRPATLILFHPRQVDTYDRVFIIAHELGHALHWALTHDLKVSPEGFDDLNELLHVKIGSPEDMQEAFADSVALGILNARGLRSHFPSSWSKEMSSVHAANLRELCTAMLQKAGKLDNPLPLPYSKLDTITRQKLAALFADALRE
jgi:hypothetical protein